MSAGEAAGLSCPGCGQDAEFTLPPGQAFCGNENCHVFIWDPRLTGAELMADAQYIRLPPRSEWGRS